MISSRNSRLRLILLFALTVIFVALIACDVAGKKEEGAAKTSQNTAAENQDEFLESLRKKYGKKLYSRHDSELFIRHFFQDRNRGFFVDVGAFHYKNNSNTYYLEKHLGWKGIAIDAQIQYKKGYLLNRPNTKFFNYFVSDKSDVDADFFVIRGKKSQSTGSKSAAERKKDYRKIKVLSITLNDLLERGGVKKIDFLTMDIERGEPAALAGFDINRYKPELVCVETYYEDVRDAIMSYFKKHRYKEIVEYSNRDPFNSYFTPMKKDDQFESKTNDRPDA